MWRVFDTLSSRGFRYPHTALPLVATQYRVAPSGRDPFIVWGY